MKAFLIFIAINTCGWISIQAQNYIPIPEKDAHWNISTSSVSPENCDNPINSPIIIDCDLSISTNGDTIIRNKTYTKLQQTGTCHKYCTGGDVDESYTRNEYMGAIRQDSINQKVYYFRESEEFLLYDFTAGVGDTFSDYKGHLCPLVVSSIDSILINGSFRKKYAFDNQQNSNNYAIEGIGTSSGLAQIVCNIGFRSNLNCVSVNKQTLYPNTNESCDSYVSTIDLQTSAQNIKLFPNPSSSTIWITNLPKEEQFLISICNIQGTTISSLQSAYQESIEINASDFPSGIYFMNMFTLNNGQFIKTYKIIKP